MRFATLGSALVIAVLVPIASFAQQPQIGKAQGKYERLPLTFEMNQGQIGPQVKFLSRGDGYTALLTWNGMVLSLRSRKAISQNSGDQGAGSIPQSHTRTTVRFSLLGAAQSPVVIGEDQQPGRVNYFLGRNPANWHTNVPTYARVRYKNVYPGIDLVYYGSHRQLEYDFEIQPGADPSQIQFAIAGANQVQVDSERNLILKTGSGEIRFQSPVVYQFSNGHRVALEGRYVATDSTHIAFQLAKYDSQKSLVIDPTLVYSTYVGGSGDDEPCGIAVDSTGSVYLTGYTESIDFPVDTFGTVASGTDHIFLAKLDPSGSNLVYADYIGGSSADYGYALALDSANEAWITGSTLSSDFPVVHAYQASQPGSFNGFVTKVSADGSSLVYSTYLGGNNVDNPAGISLDSSGYAYVAGVTSSTNFPVANAYQPTMNTNQGGTYGLSGFVTKFTPDGSSLVYSTFLEGYSNVGESCGASQCWPSPLSAINGIAVDANGNAYVTGVTNTYNFPVTQNAYLTTDSAPQNTIVGFISKLGASGNLDYSTYLYGSSGASTQVQAIAVDSTGSAYVTGYAPSDGTFPVTSTSICDESVSLGGCSYAFVTKFDPTGSSLMYSTFLGLNNDAFPQSIVLDSNDDAYVSCSTDSGSMATVNGIESYSGGYDLLVAEIDPSASSELFATYLGGSGDDYPFGLALDTQGNLYVAGQTLSTDFPVTQSAFETAPGGSSDSFALKIASQSAPAFSASAFLLQYGVQPMGQTTQPQTVTVRNMGSAAMSIASIATTGDFAESDDCGNNLPAAGSCTLNVSFTPTAPGTRSGSIVFQDDAAGSPHVINLEGEGSGPYASLSPSSLTFGSTPVGNSSAAQTVALTNTGTAALSLSNFQVTGDFTQTNNCPSTLSSSASCQFQIVFVPSAVGARNGALTITDGAYNSPQTVPLTGTGDVTAPTVTPTTLTFGNQALHTSSAPQTVTLSNTSTTALTVSSVVISGDFTQTNDCSAVPANGSCTLNITFTPTASGIRNGTLTINDDAQGSPQTVSLAGTGAVPGFSVSPTNVNFGNQPVKVASAPETLTVANTGNASLTITSIQAAGDYSQSNNCATVAANGGTCSVAVTFTPTATGVRSGTITFTDSASSSPQVVTLSGTGVEGEASVSPSGLTFASQVVGTTSAAQTITLTNVGEAALTVSGVSTTGAFAQTNNCPASLAVQAGCTISVTFAPSASGTATGSVTISDSSSQDPQTVALSGTGSNFAVTSSPTSDTVQPGSTATYSLSIAPVGGSFPDAIKLSCSGAPAQTTCNLSQTAVTPGANSAAVTLTITTTASVAEATPPGWAPQSMYAAWFPLQGLGLFGLMLSDAKRRNRKLTVLTLLALLLAALLFLTACAGGTGIVQQTQTGTVPGTYTITVTGSSGTLQHSLPLTLTVQ